MSRTRPTRAVMQSHFSRTFTNLDWFALYLISAIVLFFAIYPLLFFGPDSNRWSTTYAKPVSLNDSLTVILLLEGFLLLWLWLEMPRRRKAETALKKMHSVQRTIAQASGRIVGMKSENMEGGLNKELSLIREMIGVDQVTWFQPVQSGLAYVRLQTDGAGVKPARELLLADLPWIASALINGAPVRVRRLKDLPAEAQADCKALEECGVKSLAMIPSNDGSAEVSALALLSFEGEVNWDEEVIAQLSVLASVFANAYAKKVALDEGRASEMKFRHLFDDSPIGIVLLDSHGKMRLTNSTLAQLLGMSNEELSRKSILDVTFPEDMPQTWLNLQELVSGSRGITQCEARFRRRDGTVMWSRMTLSMVGATIAAAMGSSSGLCAAGDAQEGPFLLGMIEDVTETNRAREQLERSTRMLTLALEASRTIAWEYDPLTGMISWLDRKTLRHGGEGPPVSELFSNVLQHVVPEDREKLRGFPEVVMHAGGNFSAEFRMIARDGSTRSMLGKGELLYKAGETVPRIVGVTLDVTEVKRTQFQLEQLAKRLMEAQEEERKRISRDLHDDIGQRVALLAIELDLIRQQLCEEKLRERVERLQEATDELGSDLHHLSHTLHSSKLKHLGLEAALREICQRMSHKHPLRIELDCSERTRIVPEDEALALFRVAQEALNNIARHSKASVAKVVLRYADSQATLVISDNGKGFEPAAESGGIGLVGMRERMRAVGGEFRITSAPDCGTEVEASVSLRRAGEKAASALDLEAGAAD